MNIFNNLNFQDFINVVLGILVLDVAISEFKNGNPPFVLILIWTIWMLQIIFKKN